MTNNGSTHQSTSHEPAMTASSTSSVFRLRRGDNRMIGGVCSGLATAFGIDVSIVRLIAVLSVFIGGLGPALYLIAWMIVPDSSGKVLVAPYLQRFTHRTDKR